MAKVKVIKKLLKGIGSLFKERGEAVPQLFKTPTKDPELGTRVFFNNLLEEFGEKQVKESVEITRKAWKKKQFFPGGPQGDRFEDDLVNLLETRYMSSDRLQAHPLSFNRRGAGAADRYKMPKLGQQIEMGNKKRTDLPGGPGDPDIYKNRWGEMSDNVNPITKKKIYDKPPSIIDEYADEVVDNIKTNKNVSPEDIDFAYDRGMMGRIRAAADEQLDKVRLQSKQMNAAANQITMMTNRMEELAKKGDWENAEKIRKAIEDYRLKVQSNKGTIIDDFPILIDPTRKPNAKGGRIGLFRGGLAALLRRINPRLEKQMVETGPFQTGHRADAVADMEQIKNIARNEATDLERIYELEDMIQNSPRYNKKMKAVFMELIDYEKFRANKLYDNPKLQKHMKADPEGTEAYLKWLYRSEGSDSGFNMGGRVGLQGGGGPLANSYQNTGGGASERPNVAQAQPPVLPNISQLPLTPLNTNTSQALNRIPAGQSYSNQPVNNPYSSAGWTPVHSQDHLQGGWSQQAADVVNLFKPGTRDELSGPLAGLNWNWQRLTNPGFINQELTKKQFGVGQGGASERPNDVRAWNEARNKLYDDYLNRARSWEQHYGLNMTDAERDVLLPALAISANPMIARGGVTRGNIAGLSGSESLDAIRQQHSMKMRNLSDLLSNSDLADRLTNAYNFNASKGGRAGYAEGNIVEPTGYVSPSEMKTAAGYLSPLAMAKSAGYKPTTLEALEELLEEYELDDYLTAADGGRVGMWGGGIPLAHRGIGYLWRAIKEAAEQAGKISGRTGGKYKIGDIDYLFKRSPRSKFTKEDAAGVMNPRWGRKYGLFGRGLPRVITKEQENMMKLLKEFGEDYADGGRVGMLSGGIITLLKAASDAGRLAQKGIKPWGSRQTYKQKVTKVGEDEFQKALKQHFDKELYLINKVKGPRGNPEAELFDLYEEIASKQRYSMLPEATRNKMLSQIDDSLKAMDVDGADYQNFRAYLFDEYGFPNETAFKETGSNVIPFKPRKKKAMGGQIGVGSLFRSK